LESPTITAEWNGKILAQSDNTIVVEGNHYFPPEAVNKEFLGNSTQRTTCPWKGEASYYHLEIDGARNQNAAWYYPQPKEAAIQIKDHVAFWKGVKITEQ